jgi:hypothetical protein
MVKDRKIPNKPVSDFDIRISNFVSQASWRDQMNWGFKFKNLRKVRKLLSIALQSGEAEVTRAGKLPPHVCLVRMGINDGEARLDTKISPMIRPN